MKEVIRRTFPRTFVKLRSIKDRLLVELRVIRQLRPRDLSRIVAERRRPWWDVLPVQRVRVVRVDAPAPATPLVDWLRTHGVTMAEGGHSIYLSPAEWKQSALGQMAADYPSNAGIKILKNPGGTDDGAYIHGRGHSMIHRRLIHTPRHLTLVANLLNRHGLGPRLYDLVELSFGETRWLAFVVTHVGGRVPSTVECEKGVAALRALTQQGPLVLVAPNGFDHSDFAPPDCGGNAFVDEEGRFQYVDFQNFVLADYGHDLRRLGRTAAASSHFGDTSWLRGGVHLYQSIPGSGLPAKRHVEQRGARVSRLLTRHGVSLDGRVVLDIGCNLGGMMGQYLSLGAAWCHGWDRRDVLAMTSPVLLAIGATRFSLTAVEFDSAARDLANDLPPYVLRRLPEAVVSYLSVRRHLGWLDSLITMDWRFLLYEGHEGETEADAQAHLEELGRRVPIRCLEIEQARDGDSRTRPVALVQRHRAGEA